jgi:dTDP-4-dehydrorhamnose 3,5-epimerase
MILSKKFLIGIKKIIMNFNETFIKDVYIIDSHTFFDERGIFVKVYNSKEFLSIGMNISFKENFYSFSKKNTIRGMHLQISPFDNYKLVHVIKGYIIDVIIDLRKNSITYGKFIEIELNENNNKSILISPGIAHGFIAKEDSITMYMQSSIYDKQFDSGIRYDSFGYDWKISNPSVSEKDRHLCLFNDFN